MDKYKSHIGDRVVGYLFKNKTHSAISFIAWSIIYKIIDMNTLQWFGKGMFITEGGVLSFLFMSVVAFCFIVFILDLIYHLLIGKVY